MRSEWWWPLVPPHLVADLIFWMAYGLDSLGIQISSPPQPCCSAAPSMAAVSSGLKMLSVARYVRVRRRKEESEELSSGRSSSCSSRSLVRLGSELLPGPCRASLASRRKAALGLMMHSSSARPAETPQRK